MDRSCFIGKRKRKNSGASHSNRFAFLLSMFACMTFPACGRTVAAFSICSGRISRIQKRRLLMRRISTVLLKSSPEAESGLILPSHPDFPIKSVMAPMVAASDYPFRYFLRQHCDVDLTFTQMLHCKKFINDATFRSAHLDFWETKAEYPKLVRSQLACLGDLPPPKGSIGMDSGSPLIVQLAGDQPSMISEQANMIVQHTGGKVSGFDLNCGCPQNIARKGNYGAHLAERDFDRVCEILVALRQSVPESIAVSAKIRLPTDDATLKERISMLVGTGINFLTIHGRTIYENKTKVRSCHVDRIKLAVDTAHNIKPDFPVVANGGMESYEDVQSILRRTGAVAAMSSEALLEIPNIFSASSSGLTPRERLTQQITFANQYLDVCSNVVPPLPGVLGIHGSFNVVRSHIIKFLYRYLNENTDLRNRLAGYRTVETISQARDIVNELERRYSGVSDDELLEYKSSSPNESWYRRHRKPDRRVHQKDIPVDSSLSTSLGIPETVESRKRKIRDRLKLMNAKKRERQLSGTKGFIS